MAAYSFCFIFPRSVFIQGPIHCPFTSLNFGGTVQPLLNYAGRCTVWCYQEWTCGVRFLRDSPTDLLHYRFGSPWAWCGRAQDAWLSRKPPNWQVPGGGDSTCSCRGPPLSRLCLATVARLFHRASCCGIAVPYLGCYWKCLLRLFNGPSLFYVCRFLGACSAILFAHITAPY